MKDIVELDSEMSLMDLVRKFEETFKESIKELKRAVRDELKARPRRRGSKKDGERKEKGETPNQLKPWHDEVRRVWEELKVADAKTPYKRAVAEAHLRRSGKVAVVEEKKGGKKTATKDAIKVEEKASKKVKKASV